MKKKKEIKINGGKRITKKVSALGLYLTKDERTMLYWKARKSGMNTDEANAHVRKVVEHLQKQVELMKKNKKSDEEIANKFKEEFARICEEGR